MNHLNEDMPAKQYFKNKGKSSLATMVQIANALKERAQLSPYSKATNVANKQSTGSNLYLDIVGEHDDETFSKRRSDGIALKVSPAQAQKLRSTPSMVMLHEATRAFKESPSALTKMTSGSSTGGVYQLRRRAPNLLERKLPANSCESHLGSALVRSKSVTLSNPIVKENESCIKRTFSSNSPKYNQNGVYEYTSNCLTLESEESMPRMTVGDCSPNKEATNFELKRDVSKLAVFKPEDEETGAYISDGSIGAPNPEREGMVIGGGAKRERAAYVLDRIYSGFSGVPPTVLVKLPSTVSTEKTNGTDVKYRKGSLQMYCPSDGSAEDNPSFVRSAPVSEVHKIGILDLRIFNTDRHAGNILVQGGNSHNSNSKNVHLVPIDHALTLPDWKHLSQAYFDWQFWPQAAEPFDSTSLKLIKALDITKDSKALHEIDLPEACIATMKFATMALKAGAINGLTLFHLGQIFQRPFPPGHGQHRHYFSPLEHMLAEACRRSGITYRDDMDIGNAKTKNELSRLHSSWNLTKDYGFKGLNSLETDSNIVLARQVEESTNAWENGSTHAGILPTESVFRHFEDVLQEYISSGKWKKWLV